MQDTEIFEVRPSEVRPFEFQPIRSDAGY